ncbi:MAG: ABC transporter substrate-binding protein [Thiogranum sp.]|nr:ABC transporter substrate-binding protein [Thiogranum sp.]
MLILLLCLPLAVAAGSPTQTLRDTIDGVLVVLHDAQMEKSAKREKIRSLINDRFDYETMSRSTLAQNWKQATAEQQQRFVALHARMMQDTYLVMVEEYNDQAVQYRDERIKKERYAQVDTLILDAGKEIPVNYKLRLKDGEWLVYDVVIEGISMTSNYRSSYQQLVKTDGLDGLLAKLGSKLDGATE